jgi:hypothetical protein
MPSMRLAALALFLGCTVVGGSRAGEQWALLIAVQEHQDSELNLAFSVSDARRLKETLMTRAGLPAGNILELTDAAAQKPTRANLLRAVPGFLKKPGPDDHVIVFYSGHGVFHKGQTYLVPGDATQKNLAETAVPIQEVTRALKDCKAKTKFLILDCCHGGGAKFAVRPVSAPAEDVAHALKAEELPGVVVLASCKKSEFSFEWAEREQSLFTYWLCRALEGGADSNGKGELTFEAVYEYTHSRVAQTAPKLFKKTQTPVRLIGGDVTGTPVVLTLLPEPPESLCRRLAEHLDLEIRSRGLKSVGVLEFLMPLGKTEGLGPANLPAYCAAQVRNALAKLAGTTYKVLEEETIKAAAKTLRVQDLGDPDALKKLGVDSIVTGTLKRRGKAMMVQSELVQASSGDSLVKPSGLLRLSEELLGDNGSSFDNRDRPAGKPHDDKVLDNALERQQQGNPLLKQDFPFKIEIHTLQAQRAEDITARTPRKKKDLATPPVEGQDTNPPVVLGARDGEYFEIRVWNTSRQTVALMLFIDGLNTLGQKRERLGQGRAWVLAPQKEPYVIDGWYIPEGPDAKPGEKRGFTAKRFRFVHASKSVAARQGFTDSIGLITAAFYAEKTGRDALGVGEGPGEKRNLQTVEFKPGQLLSVIQLRYVDEKELDR